MCALFFDSLVSQYKNPFGIPDRGQTMSDDKRSAMSRQFLQRILDDSFAFIVQGTGRFIEDQHRRVFQEHPRNTQALLLPAR